MVSAEGLPREELTRNETFLGTPGYAAPEQISGPSAADIRADIYGLGAVLYFLLTGQSRNEASHASTVAGLPTQPIDGDSSVVLGLDNAEPQHVTQLAGEFAEHDCDQRWAGLPSEIIPILSRMLAENPDDRFATPAEVTQALEALARQDASDIQNARQVDASTTPASGQQRSRRGRSVVWTLRLVTVAALGWYVSRPELPVLHEQAGTATPSALDESVESSTTSSDGTLLLLRLRMSISSTPTDSTGSRIQPS